MLLNIFESAHAFFSNSDFKAGGFLIFQILEFFFQRSLDAKHQEDVGVIE